ncbi:MAG: MJ0042-type zinc finger domain-containing protein, partial [Planctomycetota bacterium]|nr:MJ0042-type zinc finger domain-containing protein [Planctomycetota bacterium]
MSIRVTCPGCHARFNVSDQFAGKSGPCPKCKKTIQ